MMTEKHVEWRPASRQPEDTGDISIKRLDFAETKELQELWLIAADLEHAEHAINLARGIAFGTSDPASKITRLSLIRDAIVLFCACFGKDELYKLNREDVFAEATGDWRAFLDEMKSRRDAYIAHRFGKGRQAEIVMAVEISTGGKSAAAHVIMTWPGYDEDGLMMLGQAIADAQKWVRQAIDRLESSVNAQIEKLTDAELTALPQSSFAPPQNIRKRRT